MDIGVVIGRFQVEALHEGHRFLLNMVLSNHRKVIVFIGVPEIQGTQRDPLDFPTRRRMLAQEFPEVEILPLKDHQSDNSWSDDIDRNIRNIFPNVKAATLYGGRNSFIPHYAGQFKTNEVDSGLDYKNGTRQRVDIGKVVRGTPDFRAGVIYSTQNGFPYVKACVDMAYMKKGKLLVGRKEHEVKYRLPGGMVDPGENFESAVLREMAEETGVMGELDGLEYVGSAPVEDWRFEGVREVSLITTLFTMEHPWESPSAKDDLVEVRWVTLVEAEDLLMDAHKPLLKMLNKHLNKKLEE